MLYAALGIATLEIIKGIGEGIAQSAQATEQAATGSVKGIFNSVGTGLQQLGEKIASGYESFLNEDSNTQAAAVGAAASKGANEGVTVGAMGGSANSTQPGSAQ